MAKQRREFLVRGRNHGDVLARLRLAMKQADFNETLKITETSAKFYPEDRGFWQRLFPETKFVEFTALIEGEDTRLVLLADTDTFLERATEVAVGVGAIPLEEA